MNSKFVLAALTVILPFQLIYAQNGKTSIEREPTIEQSVDFLLSQIELDDRVKLIQAKGKTVLQITRLKSTSARAADTDFIELDLRDFDEHGVLSTDALFSCGRKGCVKYLDEPGGKEIRSENQIRFTTNSSDRAMRMVHAGMHIKRKAGSKSAF